MKKLFSLLLLAIFLQVASVNAQPIPEKNNDGLSGQVTLLDNSVVTGTVKDNIRKKGEVIVLRDGKKTKYTADNITSVQIAGASYITNNSTFYEVIWQGKTISLLRKANKPSGIQYNGAEPVMLSGSEGDVDDYFVKKSSGSYFHLLTKKNQKDVLGKLCSTCAAGIDETKFDEDAIKKAVADCDNCK